MKVIVYSVPGTGTRFCNKFVEDILGYEMTTESKIHTSDAKHNYIFMHTIRLQDRGLCLPSINMQNMRIDKIMYKCPNIKLLSPLRDPYLSYITRLHYETIDRSESEYRQMMINHWRTFMRKTKQYSAMFVYVGCPKDDRQKLLQTTAQQLGAQVPKLQLHNFVKEWPKVGTTGDSEMKTEYLTHGTIEGKKPTFLNFAVDWVKRHSDNISS